MSTALRAPTSVFFFFNDTATTEIYTLSLHDALPISEGPDEGAGELPRPHQRRVHLPEEEELRRGRSEEHTSELQSQSNLVCRLLLEKKKNRARIRHYCSSNCRCAAIDSSTSQQLVHT